MRMRDILFRERRRMPGRRELAAALGLTALAALGPLLPGGLIGPAHGQAQPRIVSVGGVVTEVIYALGLQDRIVGVDSTSQFPPDALRDKANVGYVRALSAEGVLSLKPSMVMLVDGAGPPGAVSLLNESGVGIVRVADEPVEANGNTQIGPLQESVEPDGNTQIAPPQEPEVKDAFDGAEPRIVHNDDGSAEVTAGKVPTPGGPAEATIRIDRDRSGASAEMVLPNGHR
eukprot:gene2716-3564_t